MSWETLIAALESPQGSTYYTLLVLLLLSAAYLWLPRRARPEKLDDAVSLVLGILIVLRLVELIVTATGWSGNDTAVRVLPPLERALHLFSVGLIAYLWSKRKETEKKQNTLFGLFLLVGMVISGLMLLMWLYVPPAPTFNYTGLDYAWTGACVVALALGVAQVLRARQTLGLVAVTILFVGQTLHLLLAEPFGNMPIATQAAHLVALPLLFLLPVGGKEPVKRIKLTDKAPDPELELDQAGDLEQETQQEEGFEEFPEFFDFDSVGTQQIEPIDASPDELAKRTAEDFEGDIVAFAHMNEAMGVLTLEAGYNLLRGTPIEPATMNIADLPQLASALQSGEVARMFSEDRLPELGVLSQALRLSFQAHLMAAPLLEMNEPGWAILLLSLERAWQLDDEDKIKQISPNLSNELNLFLNLPEEGAPAEKASAAAAKPVSTASDASSSEGSQLAQLEAENERYRQDVERLLAHIDELKNYQPNGSSQAAVQSNEVVQALQMENERLKSSLDALEAAGPAIAIAPYPIEAAQAKEELRLALEEVAALHSQLEEAQREVLAAVAQPPVASKPSLSDTQPISVDPQGKKIAANQVEVVASIAQELRQPLSSIVGYTDLLLGESVGILGALQRKFLERVRNSADRMNTLIDNLIRIAELDQAGYNAVRKPVDLSSVIDDAIGQLRTQLQEKRIGLRVDLPQELPQLNTDRDALQQILYHLLQNADAATPAEGSITLRAFIDSQKDLGEFVLIQVSDSGGGIPDDDLPRVFSRVYRSSNPVIPGVGDTGVGLTIAETLTQALGGRIWVESEAGAGATFSVLLPMQPDPSGTKPLS